MTDENTPEVTETDTGTVINESGTEYPDPSQEPSTVPDPDEPTADIAPAAPVGGTVTTPRAWNESEEDYAARQAADKAKAEEAANE